MKRKFRDRWYAFRFEALPVTVHLERDRHFHWQRLYGIQIGAWFIGAIRGRCIDQPVQPSSAERT